MKEQEDDVLGIYWFFISDVKWYCRSVRSIRSIRPETVSLNPRTGSSPRPLSYRTSSVTSEDLLV